MASSVVAGDDTRVGLLYYDAGKYRRWVVDTRGNLAPTRKTFRSEKKAAKYCHKLDIVPAEDADSVSVSPAQKNARVLRSSNSSVSSGGSSSSSRSGSRSRSRSRSRSSRSASDGQSGSGSD